MVLKKIAPVRAAAFLLLPALFAFFGGCVSPVDKDGRLRAPRHTVDLSALDWLDIAYQPAQTNGFVSQPIRLTISGVGELECKYGRSPQIWNAFSSATDDPYWNEIFVSSVHLPRDTMQSLLQRFVNEGVLSTHSDREAPEGAHIRVTGKISNKKIRLQTSNARLAGLVEDLLKILLNVRTGGSAR
jgi:hypothetical protein